MQSEIATLKEENQRLSGTNGELTGNLESLTRDMKNAKEKMDLWEERHNEMKVMLEKSEKDRQQREE